jgi:hypothetical protein
MSKKLLSEAQVRKFMGLANVDANLSSNFVSEMYHAKKDDEELEEGMHDAKKDDEMEEGMHDAKKDDEMSEGMHDAKVDDEMSEGAHEEADMKMDAELDGGEPEEADESEVDVMLDQDEVADAKEAANKLVSLLDKLMGGAPPAMDADPEPEMEMDVEDEVELQEKHGAMKGDELAHSGKGRGEKKGDKAYVNEDEVVQEVARRVAKRINEAAKAKKD